MRTILRLVVLVCGVALLSVPGGASAQDRETPYWASISAGQARMRTGPGRNFPISWLYQRADLPVRVVEVYENWRKIEDPDGTQGWMLVNLLSADRTAMIVGDIRPLREAPQASARIRYQAEPGVVGRIRSCRRGWCEIDVRGRSGFVRTAHLFGVGENERVD
ncbi:MAG: SH3 domain-containing protein [Parasphingopyxis sp.]